MKHTMLVLTLTLLLSSAASAQAVSGDVGNQINPEGNLTSTFSAQPVSGNTINRPASGSVFAAQAVSGNTVNTPGTANPAANFIWCTMIGLLGFGA